MAIGVFDLKRRRAEWSVYDIKVPLEWLESIGTVCSLIALAVLWCHTLIILHDAASSRTHYSLDYGFNYSPFLNDSTEYTNLGSQNY